MRRFGRVVGRARTLVATPRCSSMRAPRKTSCCASTWPASAPAQVQSATVRLYAINPSNLGGQFTKTNDTNWNEDTVTWDTASAGNDGSLGTLGPVASNTWYELDVTPLITGDGPVSIRITSTSSDGADYAATEHPNGFTPELIIELG